MARNTQSGPALRDIYCAMFRHKRKAITFFLAVMILVTLVTVFSPRVYRSEGTMFVRLGRENMTLDPTVTLGQEPTVAMSQSRENEINSVAEILQSRRLIEKVVEKLGTDTVMGKNKRLSKKHAKTALQSTTERDKAVTALSKNLRVWPVRKSSVIQLTYEGRSPELSQKILATLIDSYLDQHARLNRPPGTHKFLDEQTQRLHSELTERENELRDLKGATGLVSPEGQRKILVERIGRIEDELSQAAADVASFEAEVRSVHTKLSGMSATRINLHTTGLADEGTDGIRGQLYALQIKEQEASAKYTEEHPKMKEIRRQVAEAKALLANEKYSRTHVTTGPNNIYEQGRLKLLVEEPKLSSIKAKANVLGKQLLVANNALQTLNHNELQIVKLQREIKLLEDNYQKYSVNLEQARIDQALEIERLSNIDVVQPATYNVKPVRPRKRVNLALGFVVAVCGAVGLALLLEYRDHSLRSPEDIEHSLRVPMLVSIPRMRNEQFVLNGSKRFARKTL